MIIPNHLTYKAECSMLYFYWRKYLFYFKQPRVNAFMFFISTYYMRQNVVPQVRHGVIT